MKTLLITEVCLWTAMWIGFAYWRWNLALWIATTFRRSGAAPPNTTWIRITGLVLILGWTAQIVYCGSALRYQEEQVWSPSAKLWPIVPITVTWDRDEFERYNESFDQAVKAVNAAVGCKLLNYDADDGAVDIVSANGQPCGKITTAWPLGPDDAAGTWLCGATAEIQIQQLGSTDDAYKIALHELGHALGLAHGSGIMTAASMTTVPISTTFTDRARDELRAIYCGGSQK